MSDLVSQQSREIEAWFVEAVLPHEPALLRYLGRLSIGVDDREDLLHEIYARLLLLTIEQVRKLQSTQAFLFMTARNTAVDWMRHRRVIAIELMADVGTLNVLDGMSPVEERLTARQEVEFLADVIAELPERCRQVFTLRKIYGLSQREIAAQLGIAEHTVEKHITHGLRECMQRLLKRDAADERAALRRSQAGITHE